MWKRKKPSTPQKRIDSLRRVNGALVAIDYLELQPKARVVGDVTYKTLEMHLGAVIRGRLNHAEPGTASVVELKRALPE